MLSRIAESLFWIGRYVERAEDTARLLDVHVQSLLESANTVRRDAAVRRLLAVMGVDVAEDLPVDVPILVETLGSDPTNAASIAASLAAARENARGVREVISAEMWECLNGTYNRLSAERSAARRRGPGTFLTFVRAQAAMFAGLTDSTMSRDEGWHFILLGRSLERVDMVSRLLAVQLSGEASTASWVLVLRAVGGYSPLLRASHGSVTAASAAEFLLRDRLFPRSAMHALVTAEAAVAVLEPEEARVGLSSETRRVLGSCRAELEYASGEAILDDVADRLRGLQESVALATAALGVRFFRVSAPVEWSEEAS